MTRKRNEKPRVFCIGWHKTGTSSLGHALVQLGYSVLGCRLDMVHPLRQDDLEAVLGLAGQFDALQDVPWAALYRELDQAFPGSRFILTEREEQSWLRSALRHFDSTTFRCTHGCTARASCGATSRFILTDIVSIIAK